MPRKSSTASAPSTESTQSRRFYVLDTNVLMHDPAAIFRFDEHDIFLPMVVLEELDHHKKGLSEPARNVRQVSRFLDEIMQDADKAQIDGGLPIPSALSGNGDDKAAPSGRLFFQTRNLPSKLPAELPGQAADNVILAQTLALQAEYPRVRVTLVSKDINLRIKAAIVGIHAEDYYSDRTIEDADLLDAGTRADAGGLLGEPWPEHALVEGSRPHLVRTAAARRWPTGASTSSCTRTRRMASRPSCASIDGDKARLELVQDYRSERHSVWGITARNREQNFALNLLLDPDIDLVTILGPAGTGKTLLTLAAGLMQTLETNLFAEIIMTRVTIPLGEDIGFLPGTEEEKMEPWMGALMDNLEVLTQNAEGGNWGRAATNDLLRNRIKIRSLNFMRGRTFMNRYVIIDEAQNLTPKQMKALLTRAGPGTKMVCLGNIAQIDTPYLTETTSGLTYVVNRFRGWPHGGHITLRRGERSRLADQASEIL